jgi:hypothetical protein
MPRHFGKFVMTAVITLVIVAIAWRVPALKKIVYGE